MTDRTGHPRVVAITGGSDGMGRATGIVFAQHGWRVSICGRRREQLDLAAADIQAAAGGPSSSVVATVAVDLCQLPAAQAFIDQTLRTWGRVDMLVNSAGAVQVSPVAELNDHDFAALWETNVGATFRACRAALPHMEAAGQGVIVNISSLAAIDPFPGFAVYGACKAWVDLFTHALAQEVRSAGIRVYSLRPGAVETKMLRRWFPDLPGEQVLAPAAVAETIWRLADPAWAPATGAAFPVRL